MTDLRKLVASALRSSDLSVILTEESAVDRVLALATADRLGSLLWRLRFANDPGAWKPAVLLLQHRLNRSLKRPLTPSMAHKVAERALREWLDDLCRRCHGRAAIVPKNSPVATHSCPLCNGTGLSRPSDAARAKDLGIRIEAARKLEDRFANAHNLIATADSKTFADVAAKLGRRKNFVAP